MILIDEMSDLLEEDFFRIRELLRSRARSPRRGCWAESAPRPAAQIAVAGSSAQYRHYCDERRINPRELLLITNPIRLRGMRGCRLHKIGTWAENRRLADEVRELERMGYFSEVITEG